MTDSSTAAKFESIVSSDQAPRGCVARIEKQSAHEEFLNAGEPVPSILISLTDAEIIHNEGRTLWDYIPDETTTITTTTVADDDLSSLSIDREEKIIRGVQPDYHIPGDVPVYNENFRVVRKCRIFDNLCRLADLAGRIEDTSVGLLPLIKGVNQEEWSRVGDAFDELGADHFVFYGTQYYTRGPGFGELREHICTIASMMPDKTIMTIGPMSPEQVNELPHQVVATAGLNQWRVRTRLRDCSPIVARRRYRDLRKEIESSLDTGQSQLGNWNEGAEAI